MFTRHLNIRDFLAFTREKTLYGNTTEPFDTYVYDHENLDM